MTISICRIGTGRRVGFKDLESHNVELKRDRVNLDKAEGRRAVKKKCTECTVKMYGIINCHTKHQQWREDRIVWKEGGGGKWAV